MHAPPFPALGKDVKRQTTSTNVALGDQGQVVVYTDSGSPTLPAISTLPSNYSVVVVFDGSSGTLTLTRSGSDTINGATTLATSTRYDAYWLVHDNSTAWIAMPFEADSAGGGSQQLFSGNPSTDTASWAETWTGVQACGFVLTAEDAASASNTFKLYLNTDTTDANYHVSLIYSSNAGAATATEANTGMTCVAPSGGTASLSGFIWRTASAVYFHLTRVDYTAADNQFTSHYTGYYKGSIPASITGFTLTSDQTTGIDTNSFIRFWEIGKS